MPGAPVYRYVQTGRFECVDGGADSTSDTTPNHAACGLQGLAGGAASIASGTERQIRFQMALRATRLTDDPRAPVQGRKARDAPQRCRPLRAPWRPETRAETEAWTGPGSQLWLP